ALIVEGEIDEPDSHRMCEPLEPSLPNALGILQVALGPSYSCALSVDGTARCWGENESGALGNGSHTDSSIPVEVVGLSDAVKIVAGGHESAGISCALRRDGSVWCWGDVEDEVTHQWKSRPLPVRMEGLANIDDIAIGGWSACAISDEAGVQCFEIFQSRPTPEVLPADTEEIAMSRDQICARSPGGTIECVSISEGEEVPAPPELEGAIQIAAGELHFCARSRDALVCWGSDESRQLEPTTPVECGDSLALGDHMSCQRTLDGQLYCWGSNTFGKLGQDDVQYEGGFDGSGADAGPVSGLAGVLQADVGLNHVCAVTTDGLFCWGANHHGQLGAGSTVETSKVPLPVAWSPP
ncbi:MAG TPA: hypothetical protein VFB62_05320, partial [Polyangiaceae bacterium]|nr:hypothetical protein [Polyangiaceae bacterium]